MVFEICERTDRQRNEHTYTVITIVRIISGCKLNMFISSSVQSRRCERALRRVSGRLVCVRSPSRAFVRRCRSPAHVKSNRIPIRNRVPPRPDAVTAAFARCNGRRSSSSAVSSEINDQNPRRESPRKRQNNLSGLER